jgi:DNA mismatch endonuclease (patch repair protein)
MSRSPTKGSWASSDAARKIMQGNRGRDTRPELALRSALHGVGERFLVDAPLPGLRRRADILFSRARVAVFVDGCFWHGCPDHFRPPKTNARYWREKVERNRERDLETSRALAADGWTVVRIWEHEDIYQACRRLVATVALARGTQLPSGQP